MNKRAHPPGVIQMGNAQRRTRRVRAGMTEDAQSLEGVGTPGHSVCTQLDHPHENESLHHGSPLSEFISTYRSQELSTRTLDLHTWILGSAVLCPTLSYGKFSVCHNGLTT